MADVLIRDVPDDVVAALDAHADRLGLSRSEFVRRRLAQYAASTMRVLLIGAPGAGKGTQAGRVAAHFGLTHISSGDLLRQHVSEGTATGRAVQGYLERGDLVPDATILDMLRKPVVAANAAGGYVLDGFPRTVEQAEAGFATARELGVAVQSHWFAVGQIVP